MKHKYIYIFTTSILVLFTTVLHAQTALDTVNYKERYGLRVGVDLSKPLRTLLQEDYRGLELMGDYRIYDNYYLAAELGNEQLPFEADNLRVTSNGSYIKIGADYNAYDNWAGMENIIFGGLRYGFATFTQTLEEYDIYTRDQYFPPHTVEGPFETAGLTAHWVELVVGLKVEILHNLYLGGNVQLKRMITQTSPNNLDNLTIPGFNRTYDDSSIGVGYSYNLSYLIPLYRRERN
jgi:hypothetical protein